MDVCGASSNLRCHDARSAPLTCENRRVSAGIEEVHRMDKKAKTPKKPKQTKNKDGSAKTK